MYATQAKRVLFLTASIFFFLAASHSHAATIVTSDITIDTHWDIAGSPYVISNSIRVHGGSTLTIDPGVIVQFDYGTAVQIEDSSSIAATGTGSSPVYITSLSDTSIPGSDTEYDDLGLTPIPGDYTGFVFKDDSRATFENVEMRYADLGMDASLANATISVSHSNFRDENSGILMFGGSLTLESTIFSGEINPVTVDISTAFTHSGNTFTDTVYPGFGLTGDEILENHTFTAGDGPYILFSSLQLLAPELTVTVESGVIFQSDTGHSGFRIIGGTFSALGDASNRITFDGVGVDSNMDGRVTLKNVDIKNVPNVALAIGTGGTADLDAVNFDTIGTSAIRVTGGTLHASGVAISHASNDDAVILVSIGGSLVIRDSSIDGGMEGVAVLDDGNLDADGLLVKNCTESGIVSFDAGLGYGDSSVRLRNSEIRDNTIGLFLIDSVSVDISGNTIQDNLLGAIAGDESPIDLSNNWWGDNSGPENDAANPDGLGNAVSDNIIFSPWTIHGETPPPLTPVLIVPGVLGTEINQPSTGGPIQLWLDLVHTSLDFLFGDTFMDPLKFNPDLTPSDTSLVLGDVIRKKAITADYVLFNYTDGLISSLHGVGYVEGSNLFTFPYDWRYGVNEDTVTELKNKITDILAATGSSRVDIVAHSTGGLLVKKYAIENPDSHHIGKTVFVGVPNTGAPKAVKVLLEGDTFGIPFLRQDEMKSIAVNIPAVYDLSPSQIYYDTKGSYIKIVNQHFFTSTSHLLDFNHANSFLTVDHSLNNDALTHAHNLHTADFDNYDLRTLDINPYAIDGCRTGTIGKVVEVRADTLFGGTAISYNAPIETPGDGTVPLESATNLPIDSDHKYYALEADHGQMMSQKGIRQQIVNILSGSTLSTDAEDGHHLITQDIALCELDGHAISIYSPLSIDITDQNGNHSGTTSMGSIENTIPNADYEIMGDHKFVYLPEANSYTISLKGTGNGSFTLTDATIANNQITQTQVFKNIPVTPMLAGGLNASSTSTLALDTNGDGNTDQTLHPSFVLNAAQSVDFNPQETDPPSDQIAVTQTHSTNGHPNDVVPVPLETPPAPSFVDSAISMDSQLAVSILPVLRSEEVRKTPPSTSKNEHIEKNSVLTAAAAGSGVPVNKKIILVSILGFTTLFFIGRKLSK